MRGKRLYNQLRFMVINNPYKRADWLRKNDVFHFVGKDVSYQPRRLPLYGQLISIGNNVVIASNVSFITHDGFYAVCNRAYPDSPVNEKVGCIKIGNNCFIGANAILMYDTNIGDDVVVAAGAVVTKDIPSGEVWGGVPVKRIGFTKELKNKQNGNVAVAVRNETMDTESVHNIWGMFNKKRNM